MGTLDCILFCIDTILYILVIVCIQTRDDKAVVAKVRNSTPLKRLLELAVVLATLFLPLTILWVPFITDNYGFSGYACGLKEHGEILDLSIPNITDQNTDQNNSSGKDLAITLIYKYAVIKSTIATTIFSTLAIVIVYCTLPAKYHHAKHSVRNMVFFFASIATYLLTYSLIRVLLSLNQGTALGIFSLCLDGYIVVFHFTKFCQPIRKLFSFKKPEPHQQQEAAPLQEQVEEVKNYESVKQKQSSMTPETHFTIYHTASPPPTAE